MAVSKFQLMIENLIKLNEGEALFLGIKGKYAISG